jgi:NAD(P)-dependent dehydrogenase (short-subunit alcohol dehydrogenase family)
MVARRLDGKRVVITGAATGIGRAAALLFAEEGARLVVGDLNEAEGMRTVDQIRAMDGTGEFIRVDVSRADEVKALMDRAAETLGGIDVILNDAGVQYSGRVEEFPEDNWDVLMAVNPKSCFLAAKYGVPHLRASGGGVIVNMASLAGVKGGPGMTAYSASKGAIVAFSKALAAELGPEGIRVNSLCPGWIDTPFNQPAIDFMGGRDRQEAMILASVPMERQGTPDEIARALVFLASDDSSYITGQALIVDGGIY